MAVLTPVNVIPKYVSGDADMIGLFALKNVSGNDTIDLATLGQAGPAFQVVERVVLISTKGWAGLGAFAGTVVTMPAAMPAASSGYMTVWGC